MMDLASIDHLLTTTRSVRKRLDFEGTVDPAVLEECLRLALQAPSGSNRQTWHFMILTDRDLIARVSELYAKSFAKYAEQARRDAGSEDPVAQRRTRVADSAQWLADNMHRSPAMVIACQEGRVEAATAAAQASLYGSILPAAWSFMLALRSRGLGTCWTTLHLVYEKQVAEMLGIPDDYTQGVLLPIAPFTGEDFRPAARRPLEEVVSWNRWGAARPGL